MQCTTTLSLHFILYVVSTDLKHGMFVLSVFVQSVQRNIGRELPNKPRANFTNSCLFAIHDKFRIFVDDV